MAARNRTDNLVGIQGGRRPGGGGTGTHLHQGKYAPDSFVIPGQDNNGNSVREWCRVMPLLDRAMDIIFSSRKFPFKSKGDLMRWCIKVGVDRLEEMEPVDGSVSAQIDAMIMVLQGEQSAHQFMTLFNTMSATVGEHIQAQALGEARRVISDMTRLIQKIDNEYWRGRYLEELNKRFGYLLKGDLVAGAGIGQHDDHGPDRGSMATAAGAGIDEEEGEGEGG